MRCFAEIVTALIQRAGFYQHAITYVHTFAADPISRIEPSAYTVNGQATLYVRFDSGHLELVAFLPLVPMPEHAPELEAVAS